MQLKTALPVFVAGMITAGLAIQAIDDVAAAGPVAKHNADAMISYALGWDLGRQALANMESDGVSAVAESLALGFEAAVMGKDPAFGEQRMKGALIEFNDQIFASIHEERMQNDPVYQAQAAANARAGEAFSQRFAALDNVQRTDSGTLYRVERSGDGETPKMGDTVIINYSIYALDGTKVGDGDAEVVDTRTMLRTTQELVLRMKVGDKWTIVVDPRGSAGLAGRGFGIGPSETVVAELELLGIDN